MGGSSQNTHAQMEQTIYPKVQIPTKLFALVQYLIALWGETAFTFADSSHRPLMSIFFYSQAPNQLLKTDTYLVYTFNNEVRKGF